MLSNKRPNKRPTDQEMFDNLMESMNNDNLSEGDKDRLLGITISCQLIRIANRLEDLAPVMVVE